MTTSELFRLPDVRRLWLAQAVSVLGDYLALYAVLGAVAFRAGGGALAVAAVWGSFMAPLAAIGPLGGVVTDRCDARKLMIAADLGRAALALTLAFATQTWQLCALVAAISALSALFLPAQSVVVRSIVPVTGLGAANAYTTQATQVISMVTPALAALIVARAGPRGCYIYDALSFVFSAAMLTALAVHVEPSPRRSPPWADLVAGGRYVFGDGRIAFVVLAITLGMFVIRGSSSVMAVYVRDALASSIVSFGTFASLVGIGTIAGAQLAKRAFATVAADRIIVAGLSINAVGVGVLGLAHDAVTVGVVTLAMGVGGGAVIVASQTILQTATPRHLLGRVSGVMLSLSALAQLLGTYAAGWSAGILGVRSLYLVAGAALGVICAASAAWLWRVAQRQETASAVTPLHQAQP